jgi:hypothetical protein
MRRIMASSMSPPTPASTSITSRHCFWPSLRKPLKENSPLRTPLRRIWNTPPTPSRPDSDWRLRAAASVGVAVEGAPRASAESVVRRCARRASIAAIMSTCGSGGVTGTGGCGVGVGVAIGGGGKRGASGVCGRATSGRDGAAGTEGGCGGCTGAGSAWGGASTTFSGWSVTGPIGSCVGGCGMNRKNSACRSTDTAAATSIVRMRTTHAHLARGGVRGFPHETHGFA